MVIVSQSGAQKTKTKEESGSSSIGYSDKDEVR